MADANSYKGETNAIITPKFAFGINSDVAHNLAFGDDQKILFPVGRHISSYDLQAKEMTFLLNHEKVLECVLIRISPDRNHLAVVERLEEGDVEQVSVFKLDTDKRVKTLTLDSNMIAARSIVNVDFSLDGKMLMVQCAEPDYMLLLYRWFSGKLIANVRVDFSVIGASICSEIEQMQIVVHSEHRARIYSHDTSSDQLKMANVHGAIQKVTPQDVYVGHAWLAGGLLALASSTGVIYLAEDGEVSARIQTEAERLYGICRFGLGFVAVTDSNGLLLYESPDGLQSTQYGGPAGGNKTANAKAGKRPKEGVNRIFSLRIRFDTGVASRLQCLAVSPNEESLVISTSEAELLHLPFDDLSFWGDHVGEAAFDKLWKGFHQGAILGVDICQQLPHAATISNDKIVKVWNYETWDCLVHKMMMDHVWSVSLHPGGTSMALGMTDKLRVYMILKDDILEVVALPIRKCDVVRFSNGGKFFAAVNSRTNNIHVYNSYNYELKATLQGHMGGVMSLSWSPDDTILISAGAGGALYRWDAVRFERLREADHVDKAHMFTCIQMDSAGKTTLARSEKGRIMTINEAGMPVFDATVLPGENPVLVAGGGRIVLAPTSRGSIITYSWPRVFPAPKDFDPTQYSTEFKIHKGSIVAAALSADGSRLLTCSEDGVLFVSTIKFVVDGSALDAPGEPLAPFPKVCMVLEETQAELTLQLTDMQAQLKRGKEDTEYQIIMQTQKLKEELAQLSAEKRALEDNIDKFRNEMYDKSMEASSEAEKRMHDLERSHMSAAEALENMYERRLLLEIDRFNRLQADKVDASYAHDEKLRTLEEAHRKVMQELTMDYEQRMKAQAERIVELEQLNGELQGFYDEYIAQQEIDYEEVHDKQQTQFDKERHDLTQEKLKMKTEALMMRTQVEKMRKNVEREYTMQTILSKDKEALVKQLKDQKDLCAMMELEVKERNDVIQQNYITIQDLRHKVRDLEMYKFVLGHKAEEMSEQIEPTKKELRRLEEEMGLQDGELESRAVTNQRLKHTIKERDANIGSLKSELFQARSALQTKERAMDTMIVELDRAMNMKSMPDKPGRLSDRDRALQKMYRGYVLKTQAVETAEETEAELQRQHMAVEKKSVMLEARVAKTEAARQRKEKMRLEENSALLKENTELSRQNNQTRLELRECRRALDEMRMRAGSAGRARTADAELSPTYPARDMSGAPSQATIRRAPMSSGTQGSGGFSLPGSRGSMGSGGFPSSPGRTASRDARFQSASKSSGGRPVVRTLRTAGHAPSSAGLVKGSPARIMNEMVSAERETVMQMAMQLDATNSLVERQRQELIELRGALGRQLGGDDDAKGPAGGVVLPPVMEGSRPHTVGGPFVPPPPRSGGGSFNGRDGRPGTSGAMMRSSSFGAEENFPPRRPDSSRDDGMSGAGSDVGGAEDGDVAVES